MDTAKIQQKLNEDIKLFPYMDTLPKLHQSISLASGVKSGDVEIGEHPNV